MKSMIKIFCISYLLLSSINLFAIDPEREYILTPDSIGWVYEKLEITTGDNFKLKAWIYEANIENDKETVLILASSDAGNMSYFVYHAATLANAGYTVVTFDYRGFGQSSDFEINKNYLYHTEFSVDLRAIVNSISSRFNENKIGIWSLSMGTTVTSRAFSEIKEKVDFIIGEGFVTETSRIIKRIKDQKDKELILPEMAPIYSNEISKIDVPILILCGSKDKVTTTNDAIELREKVGEKCKVVEYEGEHLRGFQAGKDMAFGAWYTEQINTFLENL